MEEDLVRAKKSAEKDIARLAKTSAAAAVASSSSGSEREEELQSEVTQLMVSIFTLFAFSVRSP